jgi:hypothetical protein
MEVISSYDTAAIRQMLADGLTDHEIDALCFDYFRPVYDQISAHMSKGQKIQLLIEYCDRQNRIPQLLDAIKEANPTKYAQYAPRLGVSAPDVTVPPAEKDADAEDLQALKRELVFAERVLAVMEDRVAGYSDLNVPLHLAVTLDEQRDKVSTLKRRIGAYEDPSG